MRVKIRYMFGEVETANILVDIAKRKVISLTNFLDPQPDFIKLPFGRRTDITFEDVEALLEERCLSRHNAVIKQYLDSIGLMMYDPWDIVEITHGEMAEDDIRVYFEEV